MTNTIKIIEKKQNPLLDRMELSLSIYHPSTGTPDKKVVAKMLSEQLNTPTDNIVVKDCYTRFGTHIATALVKVYNNKSSLEKIEHKFILNRILKEKEGKEVTRLPRKLRKEEKNKKKKIRGTLAALQKKAEKRQQRNS